MTPEELLSEWTGGEQTGLRPARVQALRGDLIRVTGEAIPHSRAEIEAVMDSPQIRGVITRRLREAVEDQEEAAPQVETEGSADSAGDDADTDNDS